MITIIQSYKSERIFTKTEYTHENRTCFWNENEQEIHSKTGYVEGRTLFLPESLDHPKNLEMIDLIVIQDVRGFDKEDFLDQKHQDVFPNWFIDQAISSTLKTNKNFFAFSKLHPRWYYEIFELNMTSFEPIHLSLHYDEIRSIYGHPKRSDHPLAALKSNSPIRYKLNGKSDYSHSSRKERGYLEMDYILEYAGIVEHIQFIQSDKIGKIKSIPFSKCKEINERKINRIFEVK